MAANEKQLEKVTLTLTNPMARSRSAASGEPARRRKDQSNIYSFITGKHAPPMYGPSDAEDLLFPWRRAGTVHGIMKGSCQMKMRCIIGPSPLDRGGMSACLQQSRHPPRWRRTSVQIRPRDRYGTLGTRTRTQFPGRSGGISCKQMLSQVCLLRQAAEVSGSKGFIKLKYNYGPSRARECRRIK